MTTLCKECDHVLDHTRSQPPYRWLCIMFPRKEGVGFVHPTYWTTHAPYMPCTGINGGECPMYKERKTDD